MGYYILLSLLGSVCILLEFFIPGGVVGIAGGLLMIYSIAKFYKLFDELYATIFLAAHIIIVPIIIILGLKIFPKTYFGKKLIISDSLKAEGGYSSSNIKLKELIGKEGITKSTLRPSGKITINNNLYDAISYGDWIDPNTNIKVVQIQNNSLVVEKI